MGRHPWVGAAREGVRFGVLLNGARSRGAGGWDMYLDPVGAIVRAARHAESSGIDAVFVPDDIGSFPDPFSTLAAVAASTSRIRIGTLVACIGLRHPVLLARQVSDIDRLSGGRLVLGVGIGESEEQLAAVGAGWGTIAERQAALAEALEVVNLAWGAIPIARDVESVDVATVRITPPVQEPSVPVLIGGAGRNTLRQVARLADACNFGSTWDAPTPRDVRRVLDVLRAECNAADRDYDDILRTFLGMLVLGPSDDAVRRKLERYTSPARAGALIDMGWLVAGTPREVARYYRDRIDAGMQYFVAHLTDTLDLETMELLANEVAPRLR